MSIKRKRPKVRHDVNTLYKMKADGPDVIKYCFYCKKEIGNKPYYYMMLRHPNAFTDKLLYFCTRPCHDLFYISSDAYSKINWRGLKKAEWTLR